MPPVTFRSRLAPTPSGYLHLGNVFSFLLTWLLVRREKGELLLRIDDIDAERKRPEYVQDIFETLGWLQLDYEYGPKDVVDFETNWSQHKRLPLYEKALQKLVDTPGAVFACTCSRAQLAQSGNSTCPGTCADTQLPLHTPGAALRLRVADTATVVIPDVVAGTITYPLGETSGSFVIRRRNGLPAYQLTSLCDDLHFGISSVVRGADLTGSTAAQLYLAEQLHEAAFTQAQFIHHPLLHDEHGLKLSKSEGAMALRTLRANGNSPGSVYSWFARAARLSATPISTLAALQDAFATYPVSKLATISDLR